MTATADQSTIVARHIATTDEPRVPTSRASVPGTRAPRRAMALGLLVSAQFVVMLDTSIVNVALPSIQADLGLSPTALTWVVNAYVLTFGGLLLLSGRVADLFGRRRLFMAGSALFTFGTVLAAAAGSAEMLVAGRVVQGVGAATLSPSAMALLLGTFPGEARAKAMSAWGAASTIGGATGVLLGGVLAGSLGWSAVFLVTVPVSVASIALAGLVLDESPAGPRRRFDAVGAVSITGAVIALVHGAVGAAEGRDWTSPSVLASLAGFVMLATVFVYVEKRALEPLVPLTLFESPVLSAGVVLAVLGGAARASTFVLVALYLQLALDMAPRQAGLAMVPTSLTGFAVSVALLPRVLRVLGPRRTLVIGLLVLASGHLWLAHGPRHTGYLAAVLPGLVLVAVGVALSFTPTTMVITSAVPEKQAGLASGLAGSASQVGGALGTAIFTAIAISERPCGGGSLALSGFSVAFTAAALVSVVTAVVGCAIAFPRRPRDTSSPAASRRKR